MENELHLWPLLFQLRAFKPLFGKNVFHICKKKFELTLSCPFDYVVLACFISYSGYVMKVPLVQVHTISIFSSPILHV